ncbi:MAG: DUF86 domain-containing protein [Saprospirales bacterium]|nr:DUF86 domain-containing protein [Saprospirales bacterium]
MSKSSIEFMRHIFEETQFIIENSEGLSREGLDENEVLKRAIVRSLEIIGEAAKKVDEDLRDQYSSVAWSSMSKMRDKLIHHYFGVDYDIVMDVVLNKIPELHFQIQQILEEESEA